MAIQPISPNPVPLPQPSNPTASSVTPVQADPTVQTSTPAFDVTLASLPFNQPSGVTDVTAEVAPPPLGSVDLQAAVASEAVATTDLQADDIVAQAAQVLQAQQTVLAALNSGAADVSIMLSGLPPGATATLLGGGWVRVPPGTDPAEAEVTWAFHWPFHRQDVPAVTSSGRTDPTGEKGKGGGNGAPLKVYGPHGEEEPPLGQPITSTLDILD